MTEKKERTLRNSVKTKRMAEERKAKLQNAFRSWFGIVQVFTCLV